MPTPVLCIQIAHLAKQWARCRGLAVTAFLAIGLLGSSQLNAQEGAAPASSEATPPAVGTSPNVAPKVVTVAYVEELLQKFPAPKDDQAATREHKLAIEAKASLVQEQRWQEELTALEAVVKEAEADTQTIREQAKLAPVENETLPDSLSDAEILLEQLKSKLGGVTAENQKLKADIGRFTEEKLAAASQLNEAKARLIELKKTDVGDVFDQVSRAARIQQLEARVSLLERTASTSDMRKAYRTAQRDLTEQQISWLNAQIKQLDTYVEKLRLVALAKQEEEARQTLRSAAMQDPIIKELAQQNNDWIETRKTLTKEIEQQSMELASYARLKQDILDQLSKIEQRMAIAGYSQSVGVLLQRELRRLPDPEDMADRRRELTTKIKDTQLSLFELEMTRNKIVSFDHLKGAYLEELPPLKSAEAETSRTKLLAQLLTQHIEILDSLTVDMSNYFEVLINTDTSILEANTAVRTFRSFAAENALWIPDREPLSDEDFTILPSTFKDVAKETYAMVSQVLHHALDRIVLTFFATVVLAVIALRLNHKLKPLRDHALSDAAFSETLLLLAFEFYVALIPVLFLMGITWTVNMPIVDNEFSDAVAITSIRIIPATISLVLLFRLTLKNNLGPIHFRWSARTCGVIHSTILYIMLPTYFIAFAASFLYFYGLEFDQNAGSRVLFLIGLSLLIWAFHRVFHPDKGVFGDDGMRFGPLRHSFVRWVVYLVLIGWIATLALLIGFGYMVGMMAMIRTTILTVWLVAGIAILDGVLTRYLRIHRYHALLKFREDASETENKDIDESRWREIDPQVRKIMNLLRIVIFVIGVAFIWREALPALRSFSEIAVIGGAESPLLTIGQLTMLFICVITTTVLAANLPSVVELVILRRIKGITPGNSHAFSTLVAYFIVLFGIIWASFIAEVEWSKVQWLIAAITVGLGFGMQEIFGNLVAGIILLFERPIRVGDIVTIDDTTGSVARIRIRGTTIREFDKREVIVPNKSIITGKLINWTLSDTMTRLKIPIGVAYGTDTDQARALLFDILRSHPDVMTDPEPRVFFTEIADSSLNFTCFVYLANMDNRLGTQSDINTSIVKRFAEAGIDIPFPQRTLHIKKDESE